MLVNMKCYLNKANKLNSKSTKTPTTRGYDEFTYYFINCDDERKQYCIDVCHDIGIKKFKIIRSLTPNDGWVAGLMRKFNWADKSIKNLGKVKPDSVAKQSGWKTSSSETKNKEKFLQKHIL